MKRLLFLVLLAAAAWYGWRHWPELVNRQPGHEAVIINHSGKPMVRVRLMVDGQTLVKERLADGEQGALGFKVADDATLELEWEYETTMGQHRWRGGQVPRGPLVQRHFITVDADDQVIYEARQKGVAGPGR
jgi:hypothetical protein